MAGGTPISPYVFQNRDDQGNIDCRFEVSFTGVNLTLTGITAYNVQGSGLTQIQVTRADGAIKTFPLPTSGKKVTLGASVPGEPITDAQGNPTTITCYSATVSQSQINAQGFTVLSDIASYTVF